MTHINETMHYIEIKSVVAGRGIIFNTKNELLLVAEDDLAWHLPGGWCDPAENVKEGCVREIKEETGLVVTADKVVYVSEHMQKKDKFKNILQRLDFYVLCFSSNYDIPHDTVDPDNNLIIHRKYFTEAEFKSENIIIPQGLKNLSFMEIKNLPNCYEWINDVDPIYLNLIKKK